MQDTNLTILIGRLTADPELKHTESGKEVCSFQLAVNGYKDDVSFIPVTAWQKTAEIICKFVKKGHKVAIEGRIKQRSYEHKDGGKRSVVEVIAHNVQFLQAKKDETNNNEPF